MMHEKLIEFISGFVGCFVQAPVNAVQELLRFSLSFCHNIVDETRPSLMMDVRAYT